MFSDVLSQKPVSCWETLRSLSGRSFTATMGSASCPDTTERRSCTGAARASKMLYVVQRPEGGDADMR